MKSGLQVVLDYIESTANSLSSPNIYKGQMFEYLIKRFFEQEHIYRKRFTKVWLWKEWRDTSPYRVSFNPNEQDTGIDLVAVERKGGFCAIQCKFRYNRNSLIDIGDIYTFYFASRQEPFTGSILVTCSNRLTSRARNKLRHCQVLSYYDLNNSAFDWEGECFNYPSPKTLTVEEICRLSNREKVSGVTGNISQIKEVSGGKDATHSGWLREKNGGKTKVFFCRQDLEGMEGRNIKFTSNSEGEGIIKGEFKNGITALGVYPEAKIVIYD